MPIVLNTSIPLPNLKVYTSISLLLVSSCLYYAFNVTSDPNWKLDSNSTIFQSRATSLEDLLSIQDEINDKETIIDNFNNLQETILAAIKATNRDEVVDVDALESGLHENHQQQNVPTLGHLAADEPAPVAAHEKGVGSQLEIFLNDKRTIGSRLRDIAAFMLQEPICIWVSSLTLSL